MDGCAGCWRGRLPGVGAGLCRLVRAVGVACWCWLCWYGQEGGMLEKNKVKVEYLSPEILGA